MVITARNLSKLEAAKRAIESQESICGNGPAPKVVTVEGNLKEQDVIRRVTEAAFENFGQIDILINNAGSARVGAFLDLTDEDFTDSWNLKLLGYIRTIRAVLPHFKERRKGSIVNIVGGAGRTPSSSFFPGGTTNVALLNFSKGISKELAKYRIRINSVSPGLTATDRAEVLALQQAEAKGISVEQYKAESSAAIPLGRLVDPQEIGDIAIFLASDRAKSITGAEILVDGGQQPGV